MTAFFFAAIDRGVVRKNVKQFKIIYDADLSLSLFYKPTLRSKVEAWCD